MEVRGQLTGADRLPIEQAFERFSTRLGPHYTRLLSATVGVFTIAVVVPAYSLLLLPYFRVSASEYLQIVLVFQLSLSVAGVIGYLHLQRFMAPMNAVMSGTADNAVAVEARRRCVGGTPRLAFQLMALYAVFCIPPALVVTQGIVDTSLAGAGLYLVVLLLLIAGMGVFGFLFFEQALRPVVRRTIELLPTEDAPRGTSLSGRLLVLLPGINLFSCIVVAMVSTNSLGLEGRLAVTTLAAILVTAVVALSLTLMFRNSLIQRLEEFRHAIRRVEEGDLNVFLPNLAGDELDEVGDTFNGMISGLRERDALHSAMGSYVAPAVAERVLAEGSYLKGEAADVTVMFVDIVGFTAHAEGMAPGRLIAELNEFFDLVIPIIEARGGHANKLLGDGIMAVFGVPVPISDHADCALSAAVELQGAVRREYDESLAAGVGLNSGTVVVGSMGGGAKLDYTIIGDVVNVAARVEAYTRALGDAILVTGATKARLTDSSSLEARGAQLLRGRAAAVELWALDPHIN